MAQFIGFLLNRSTKEEFLAPVDAQTRAEAQMALDQSYPSVVYSLLTIYARSELDIGLSSIDRWPGLPSKVQKPIEQILSHVTAHRGGLPPINRAQPTLPAATGATISHIQEKPVQFGNRLASLQSGKTAPATGLIAPASAHGRAVDTTAAVPQASAISALKAMQGAKTAGAQAAMAAAPAVAPASAAPRAGSLIAVLKAMKH